MRNMIEHPLTQDEVEEFLDSYLADWDSTPLCERPVGSIHPLIAEGLRRLIREQWDNPVVRQYFEIKRRGDAQES